MSEIGNDIMKTEISPNAAVSAVVAMAWNNSQLICRVCGLRISMKFRLIPNLTAAIFGWNYRSPLSRIIRLCN